MKRDTRSEILKTAKQLYNERGYNAVSTSDIANALKISKGNLTYYFKKKEDIIEAIIDDLSAQYKFPAPPKTLEELNKLLLHIQTMVQENAFYFWHHTQLSQLSVKIHEQQTQVYQRNIQVFSQAFSNLRKSGIIREEAFKGEESRFIDTLLLGSIYWIPFCELKQADKSASDFQSYSWDILFSWLTAKGVALFQSIVHTSL